MLGGRCCRGHRISRWLVPWLHLSGVRISRWRVGYCAAQQPCSRPGRWSSGSRSGFNSKIQFTFCYNEQKSYRHKVGTRALILCSTIILFPCRWFFCFPSLFQFLAWKGNSRQSKATHLYLGMARIFAEIPLHLNTWRTVSLKTSCWNSLFTL